jgi:hypothetical protein
MGGIETGIYTIMLIIANTIALLQLLAAIRWPRIGRISFVLLFAWACWKNWTASQHSPEVYLEYGDLAWLGWYRGFINGWFANHIQLAVGAIATCQGLIVISLLLKGWIYKIGSAGAMLFLVAILPLGIGSGFPCTGIMAVGIYILLRKFDNTFIWETRKGPTEGKVNPII